MIKIKKVEIPIYGQLVYFIFGEPYEVQNYLRDAYCGDFSFDPDIDNAIVLHRSLVSWVWFNLENITVPLIVHELDHAVFELMIDLGLELTDQEAFCYLDEFLMEQCLNLFVIQMDPTNLRKGILDQEDEQV